jgi:hypothetical protein
MEPVRIIEKGVLAGKPRCIGLKCGPEVPGTKPKRYTAVQCDKACAEGSNLCVACMRQEAANLANTGSMKFHGRFGAPPVAWSHIVGSEWNLALKAKEAGATAGTKKSVAKRAVSAATEAAVATNAAEAAVAGAGAPPAAKEAVKKAKATLAEAVKEVKEAEAEAVAVVEKALVKATRAAKKAEREASAARRTARRSSSNATTWSNRENPFKPAPARRRTAAAAAPARRLMFVPQSMAGPSFSPARRSSSSTHRRPASARSSSGTHRRPASASPPRPAPRPNYASPYSATPSPSNSNSVNMSNYLY